MRFEPTQEQLAEYAAWVQGRPPAIRAVAEKLTPWHCYRGNGGRGHYRIMSIEEHEGDAPPTLKVAHGADSFMPGFAVFGVTPESLEPCGCGNWEQPSEAQATAAASEVEHFKAAVDAAGLKILPGLKLVPR